MRLRCSRRIPRRENRWRAWGYRVWAEAARRYIRSRKGASLPRPETNASQNIPGEVLILYDIGELFADVDGIDFYGFFLEVGAVEGNVFEKFFENGVEAAGANVFGAFIDAGREGGDLFEGVGSEGQADAFGVQQGLILLGERVLGLGENADEIGFGERFEFHSNRKAALQFGDEIAGLGDVERAGGDEQNVIGADESVAGINGGSFDDGQDVALNAFAAHVGPVAAFAARDFVHF